MSVAQSIRGQFYKLLDLLSISIFLVTYMCITSRWDIFIDQKRCSVSCASAVFTNEALMSVCRKQLIVLATFIKWYVIQLFFIIKFANKWTELEKSHPNLDNPDPETLIWYVWYVFAYMLMLAII